VHIDELIRWVHLLSAATWTGGLITLAVLVVALRRAGAGRGELQAAARAFGRLSWVALATAVFTGTLQVERLGFSWTDPALTRKLGLVFIAGSLAFVHQLTARRTTPAIRGMIQGVILVVSIAIFGAAVAL
jgi:putative copper export protein